MRFLCFLCFLLVPVMVFGSSDFKRYVHKCWDLYIVNGDDGTKKCFMTSSPLATSGNYSNRSDPRLWVRYVKPGVEEVSFTPGYKMDGMKVPSVSIYNTAVAFPDKKNRHCVDKCKVVGFCVSNDFDSLLKSAVSGNCVGGNFGELTPSSIYELSVVENEQAWAMDMETDRAIINDMKNGTTAVITANSLIGTCSSDIYSLMGFTSAYKQMKLLCQPKKT